MMVQNGVELEMRDDAPSGVPCCLLGMHSFLGVWFSPFFGFCFYVSIDLFFSLFVFWSVDVCPLFVFTCCFW